MRVYSKVSQSVWQSKRFAPLSGDMKLLYLYLVTCPHGNSIGCFRIPLGYMVADLGWSQDRCSKGLSKLSDTGLIDLFPAENIVRIDKFLVHNPITNGKHAAGAAKLALALPDGSIKARVINDLLSQERALPHEIASSLERALIGLSEGYRTETETETETDTDTDTFPCHEEGICTDTGEVIALPRGRAC